jgi:CBS-domain-containing membrane protein
VQDVMTREVVAVRGPTPFKELVRLLNEHWVTAMPVLDDAERLVTGAVDGVVVVESALRWQAEDTATEVPPAEPASLG